LQTLELTKTIVLVGMMGSGKTSVGRELAEMLGVDFVDSDEEIVRASSYEIPELFARFGEAYFREKETQVLMRLLQGPPVVLSTGGGAFMNPVNRDNIARYGVAVWLEVAAELLWERVRGRGNRPLLMTDDPYQTLCDLLAKREPVYALAPVHVGAGAKDAVEDTAAAVIAALSEDHLIRRTTRVVEG